MDRESKSISDPLLVQILQSYVDSLETLETQKSQISKRILDLQCQLLEIQKSIDETMKLKNELTKGNNGKIL